MQGRKKLIIVSLVFLISTNCWCSEKIRVNYNDNFIDLKQSILLKNNRVLLPLRELSTQFGYNVQWQEELQKITISNGNKTITLFIGQNYAYVEDKRVSLDIAPYINLNTTYVPIRFVGEAFDLSVTYKDLIIKIDKNSSVTNNKATNVPTQGYKINQTTKQLIYSNKGEDEIVGDVLLGEHDIEIKEQLLGSDSKIITVDSTSGEPSICFLRNIFYIKNQKVINSVSYKCLNAIPDQVGYSDNYAALCDGRYVDIYDDITGQLLNHYDLYQSVEKGTYNLEGVGKDYILVRSDKTEGGGMLVLVEIKTGSAQKLYELIPDENDRQFAQWGNLPTYDTIRFKKKVGNTVWFEYYKDSDGSRGTLQYQLPL